MTWTKHKQQLEAALAQSMRLLVLIREALSRQPGGTQSPLYEAVVTHSNLCGTLLPNELRMSQQEINTLRAQLEQPAPRTAGQVAKEISDRMKGEKMVVLTPDGKGGFRV